MAVRQLTCAACEAQFKHNVVSRPPKYCSKRCKADATNAKVRANRPKPSPVTASMRKACEGCGVVGVKTSKGLCLSCSGKQRRIVRAEDCRRRKGCSHLPPRLVDGGVLREFTCEECGGSRAVEAKFGIKYKYCSRTCQKRASDRVRTKARRAAMNGAHAQPVDPNRVFDRDGWRCGLCGGKTVRGRRGTQHDKAPVLDHIVPLSKGGSHTYKNVQCACHACNSRKGAKVIGQLRLFG